MILKLEHVNENLVIVHYDNRPQLSIVSDNGSAASIADTLLSPRWDMTYSEWLRVVEGEHEVTIPNFQLPDAA